MTVKDYFNFFRWKNVLMIILIQYLFKYVLFEKFDLLVSLNDLHFALLTLSTVCIAIAGYIINDIQDIKADIINKPEKLFVDRKIVRSTARYLYIGFNAVGLSLGMYLSYYIGHTSYFFIYVLTAFLLYQYAKYFKVKFLIGNIIISLIILLSIILVMVFDLMPVTSNYNLKSQMIVLKILIAFSIFGFIFTFVREVVKDMEDMKGDQAIDARTVPIVLGLHKTKRVLISVTSLLFASLLYLSYFLFDQKLYLSVYLIIAVAIPLIFFMFKINKASTKNEFFQMSGLLKIIMFAGILSIFLI
jgi:4-hydroxybenzoate polyprenyltransferase